MGRGVQALPARVAPVRMSPTWFIVAPGHEAIDLENVVARYDRYLVVEKRGEAAELAAQTDPRST